MKNSKIILAQILIMKNSKIILSEEGSKHHLRGDLWPEILSSLPVKSLLRFRCVSKSWLSMINDPDFCRLHLGNFKDNHDETHLLVVEGPQQTCILRCSDTFDPITTLDTLGRLMEVGSWYVEFSIDGLVLLKRLTMEVSGFCQLRLWNPSMRKFHDIPSLPEIEASPNGSLTSYPNVEIGFGCDPLSKDYKHVKLLFESGRFMHTFAVYTLRTCSWKMIPFQGNECFNWPWSVTHDAVYLQGSLYFLAYSKEKRDVKLVSIDLSSEVFSCSIVPNGHRTGYYRRLSGSLTSVDDRHKLTFFDCDAMWVLDSSCAESEVAGWSRRYSFGLMIPQFLYHKRNDDILIRWYKPKTSTDEKSVQLRNQPVSSYNLETKREKFLLRMESCLISKICGYIESLIMLN